MVPAERLGSVVDCLYAGGQGQLRGLTGSDKGASERSKRDSASEAWPSEVSRFLGPTSRSPPILAPVKGLVGLARDVVCSRDARSPSDPPIPRPDTVAPSAERRRGVGGEDEPAGSIGRRPTARRNVRPRASGIAVAAPSVVRQQPPTPRRRFPRGRTSPCACPTLECEGQRPADDVGFFLLRPSRVLKSTSRRSPRSPCQRFCSPSCRQALRRVIERERRWRQRSAQARRSAPTQAVPRAVSWLTRIAIGHMAGVRMRLPPEGGRGGRVPGPLRAPRSLSPIPFKRRQGDESLPGRSGHPRCGSTNWETTSDAIGCGCRRPY